MNMKCKDCKIKLNKYNGAFKLAFMKKNKSTRVCKDCNKKYIAFSWSMNE